MGNTKIKVPEVKFLFRQKEDKYQIYIYDDIQESGKFNWDKWEYEESETSAKYFREQLEKIPDGSEIEIFINSNGGSVKEGTAIYNQLKRHNSHKVGYVDGVAHSIAFVILQACDHRVMGEGTSALLHEMWVCTVGNAAQLRKEADQLDDLMQASRKLFMARSKNITEEELKNLMQEETMLTPDKALEYGFIDEIAEREEVADPGLKDPQQSAKNIERIKNKVQNSKFEAALKEFKELTEEQTEEQEAEALNPMDAFFSAFM